MDLAILRVLDANTTKFGLGAVGLSHLIGQYGVTAKPDVIEKRLLYLSDKEVALVAPVERGQFHPESGTWTITARGTNFLRVRNY